MRKSIFLMGWLCFVLSISLSAQVTINTDGSNADPSAILDLKSSEKGLLIPRMTTLERDAISNPAEGLLIYNTQANAFQYYKSPNWKEIVESSLLACIMDGDLDTKVCVDTSSADPDVVLFTTDGTLRWAMNENTFGMKSKLQRKSIKRI